MIEKLRKSLDYSLAGLRFAWKGEASIRLELAILALVGVLGLLRGFSLGRWAIVGLAWVLVLAAELVNTAIEALADYVQPKRDHRQAPVYDAASAAVFLIIVFAAVASIVALIWPR